MRNLTLPHGYHKPQQLDGRRLLTMSGVVIGGAIPAPEESPRTGATPGLTVWSPEPVAQHRAGRVAANAELFEADATPARSLVTRGRLFGVLVAIAIGLGLSPPSWSPTPCVTAPSPTTRRPSCGALPAPCSPSSR